MDFESVQIVAGFASTAIFASSKVPMLRKALVTRDMRSYSFGHISLSVSGNLINWLYVISLPLGPIWILQAFFTVADMLMLGCYSVYELRSPKSGSDVLMASARPLSLNAKSDIEKRYPQQYRPSRVPDVSDPAEQIRNTDDRRGNTFTLDAWRYRAIDQHNNRGAAHPDRGH